MLLFHFEDIMQAERMVARGSRRKFYHLVRRLMSLCLLKEGLLRSYG